ncbi:hypothetical protein HK096_006107 [Nowakowskiella sp. JEL0078]|nr:hypothetical protein HK096_006107 [Nowakowskiella sp. JEL0078]
MKKSQKNPTESTSIITPSTEKIVEQSPGDSEICFICTEPISVYAVGECNHRVCHICALRLRALYKQKSCAYCKTELSKVVFTISASADFETFNLEKLEFCDQRLAIFCEFEEIYDDLMILLRFNCPEPTCDVSCPAGWGALKKHVRETHQQAMCDLCTRHKKVFTHEHTLFTQQQLYKHMKDGDTTDPSFKGHPSCGFCRINYYDSDELYDHCKQKHEQCFLCIQAGVRHQYYTNYDSLEEHFKDDHYFCSKPQCLEKKFIVFATDIDFKAHELDEHQGASSSAKKKTIQIDANFTVSGGSLSNRRGGRTGSNQVREQRDDSQAELAITQQMNFPKLGSTSIDPPTSPKQRINQQPSTSSQPPEPDPLPSQTRLKPPLGFGSLLTENQKSITKLQPSESPPPPTNEPEVQAQIRDLFQKNVSNFTEFKIQTAAYRYGKTSVTELFNSFRGFAMQDRVGKMDKADAELALAKLWTRMADSLSNKEPEKMEEMLSTLNDWKISNAESQFPKPKSKTSSWATTSISSSNSSPSARVLVIKSRTTNNQRSKSAPWNAAKQTTNVNLATKEMRAAVFSSPADVKSDFPSLASSVWKTDTEIDQDVNVQGEQDSANGKKKSKKGKGTVLMHFG